ncbi:tRNA-modifying protein YgfZ [Arsenophonus symbiont of Ornithomya chloropus]|uniref:tRNA-modifying protein YgfZ n=1 Tax=Arsenophonus symbiont of Ornithomya chloropus TaxID=634121 RepID=UPI0032B2F83E
MTKSNTLTNQLPLTLIFLNDWDFITTTGIDLTKYLQSQFTADITSLQKNKYLFTAHCNPKGKMHSTLHLFHYQKGFAYILRKSVARQQINELKKYAIFSKIIIQKKPDIILLGIVGQNAKKKLKLFFPQLPNQEQSVISFEETVLLHFNLPIERFLIATNKIIANKLIKSFRRHADSHQWLALNISAGIANIDIENSQKFIPQSANLEALPDSISFKKGCYLGQEIIALTKYRGSNKQRMFYLKGKAKTTPKIGEGVEWQCNNHWRHVGKILAAVKLNDNIISIQIIMNHEIPKNSIFRLITEENSQLKIFPLPYSSE